MIDTHCHLADPVFAADLDAVVDRARAAGVDRVLCVLAAGAGNEAAQAEQLLALWPDVRFACGVHPHQAGDHAADPAAAAALAAERIRQAPAIRLVGEIGLDYHYDFAPRDVQQQVFREQIRLARALGYPIVIHTREAEEDTVTVLEEEHAADVGGIFHCFSGTPRLAEAALALGFYLSFAGMVTFPRAEGLRAIAARTPLNRLLTETDSPYLAPVPHRGRRNEPAHVVHVAGAIAALHGTTRDAVAREVAASFGILIARGSVETA